MLKNMKIRSSLIMGFTITIVTSLALIIGSVLLMNNQRVAFQNIIDQQIAANELVTLCRLDANIAARNVRDIALIPDDPANADMEARALEVLESMDQNIATLQSIYPLKDDLLDRYVTSINNWTEVLPDILDAIHANRTEEAVRLIKTECTPRLNEMTSIAAEIDDALTEAQDTIIAQQNRSSLIAMAVMLAAMVVASLIVLTLEIKIIRSIIRPVEQVRKALIGFSEGNLEIPVEFESANELGQMCNALRTSQDILSGVIGDICRLLEEMAAGNFDIHTQAEDKYVGALSGVLKSIRDINSNLSNTLYQIIQSAEQVSAGADQVSVGAQSLAQGSTEQASSVQELSATIMDVSEGAKKNAELGKLALQHSMAAGGQVEESAQHMENMVKSIKKIAASSEEIAKIIQTIEDIAFQTNILALNAAVEAARAGSAGKGFAVVANEVRSLAGKSDEAAKATKELIDSSFAAVQEGVETVDRVSASLQRTTELAGQAMEDMKQITAAVETEAEAMGQISEGVDQISSVVQTNSATSEQSAAASEELSGQATVMKQLMAQFKLKGMDAVGSWEN